jgi:opacity protein-like surface antigen
MKRLAIVAALAVGLAGCAQAARVDQMAATPTTALPATSVLQHAVQVLGVTGGTDTNPLWMSKVGNAEFQAALSSSLGAAGMLANGEGRYKLQAKLLQLKQPMIGFDMAVDSQVHYTLTETGSGKAVFDRDVIATFTATVGDAFIAVKRLQLANEGSIKKNIQQFMDEVIVETGKGPAVSAITLTSPGQLR